MDGLEDDIKRQARELEDFLRNDAIDIIAVEGLNHIDEAFANEGFTDRSLKKWKPRKTTTNKGKDKTKYRTNRRGNAGSLTKFGRENENRPILTGHGSGGNKLRNSWNAQKLDYSVQFENDKPYAEVHNEGNGTTPKRQQIGRSVVLEEKIREKVDRGINKILKK